MIIRCCVCNKITGAKEPLTDTRETHGYCPECYLEELKRLKKQLEAMPEYSLDLPAEWYNSKTAPTQ